MSSNTANSFYGASRRPLGPRNESSSGHQRKKRRTEDLNLSNVLQIASSVVTSDRELGLSDSSLSFSDDETDSAAAVQNSSELMPQTRSHNANGRSTPTAHEPSSRLCEQGDTSYNSDMYRFPGHSTPLQESPGSLSLSSCSSFGFQPSISDMIQQQNTLIIELIKKHDSLCNTVTAIREGLDEAKLEITQLRAEKENQEPVKEKGKKAYPSSLTDILLKIHEKSERQFNPAVSSTDQVNFDVKHMLIDEVRSGCPGKYSEKQISLAVQRMYENQRRQYLNQRPERAPKAQEQEKFRSRRERLFARRYKYVPAKYRRRWDALNIHYMSEEDGPDGVLLVKKLPWRSDKLNRLIESIDTAADKGVASSSVFTPERKRRLLSDVPSALPPPQDAPKWAVKVNSAHISASSEGCTTGSTADDE